MVVASSLLKTRSQAALHGLFVGDALAMPAHWYYQPGLILRDFPPLGIDRLHPAPETHPGAIMSLHSTARGGRSSVAPADEPHVVGDIILKGRRHFWEQDGVHYHRGLPAGENTLNAYCARWLMQDLATHGSYDPDRWLALYIERMTEDPPGYPDTYAESYHRGFFANLQAGKAPRDCGAVTHDTPSIGALVTVGPLALFLLRQQSLAEVQATCRLHVSLTHPDERVAAASDAYVELLARLLLRSDPPSQSWFVEAANAATGMDIGRLLDKEMPDNQVVGHIFSSACYLEGSWPSVCFLAARHGADPKTALLRNTNLGGDNVHRGAVLGSLLGLMQDEAVIPWFSELYRHDELSADVDAWLDAG